MQIFSTSMNFNTLIDDNAGRVVINDAANEFDWLERCVLESIYLLKILVRS